MIMMSNPKVTIDGIEYEAELCKVDYVRLATEDHGLFALGVGFTSMNGASHQGDGYRALDAPVRDENDNFIERRGTEYGMQHIMEYTKVLGDLTEAVGREVYVLRSDYSIDGVMSKDQKHYYVFKDLTKRYFPEG